MITIPPFVSSLFLAVYFFLGSLLSLLGLEIPPLPI